MFLIKLDSITQALSPAGGRKEFQCKEDTGLSRKEISSFSLDCSAPPATTAENLFRSQWRGGEDGKKINEMQ